MSAPPADRPRSLELPEAFRELTRSARVEAEAGRLPAALSLLDEAVELATAAGAQDLVDLAATYRAAILIERREGEAEVPRLRAILVRNAEPRGCQFAAYNIARHYELNKNFKKAVFYARIALERSLQVGEAEWTAKCHTLLGNSLLADSHVEAAIVEYEAALALLPDSPEPLNPASLDDQAAARATIRANLGYCRALQGRLAESLALLYPAARLLRRAGVELHEMSARLDLAFALLQLERCREATRHARRAFAVAQSADDRDGARNALYLLAEAANLAGDLAEAKRCFSRLQQMFYPQQPHLADFLLAVDVRRIINLHA
jgi:tetratricopeptide (TPR) repeat protein